MVRPEELREFHQSVIGRDLRPPIGARFALDETQHLASLLVEAEDTRRVRKLAGLEILQEFMDRWRPPVRWAMHRLINVQDYPLIGSAEIIVGHDFRLSDPSYIA